MPAGAGILFSELFNQLLGAPLAVVVAGLPVRWPAVLVPLVDVGIAGAEVTLPGTPR